MIRSFWRNLRPSKLQSALLLRRIQHLLRRHLMFRQVHRHLPLHLSQPPEHQIQGRKEVVQLVLEERALALVLREEERERPMQALSVELRWLMERAHRRVAARKEREMALVLSLVVEMVSGRLRWRERILLR